MSEIFSVDSLEKTRIVATPEQLRDFGTYKRLAAKAAELGVELEIIDEAEFRQIRGMSEPTPMQCDKDGVFVDKDGDRYFAISTEVAANFPAYVEATKRAEALGVPHLITDAPRPFKDIADAANS